MTDKPILVIAYDRLGPRHAGPAIRTLAIASQLANIAPVEVLYEGDDPGQRKNQTFLRKDSVELSVEFFTRYRAVLAPPLVAMLYPSLMETDVPLVVDLFDPVVWENLELYRNRGKKEQVFQHERHLAAVIAGLMRGDYFLVAGKRQQDLFTGALMVLNRINPLTWKIGAGSEQLVGLVPFGLHDEPPPSSEIVPCPAEYKSRGPVAVWGGGMWDWLYPELAVLAWPKVLKKYPDAILVFPATDHPNPHVPEMEAVRRVKKHVEDLEITESVKFGRWLPRDEYLGLLANADVGLSAHKPGLEARYAVRTRFLDAIWVGLPMVVSGGDEYSDHILDYNLGFVVDGEDSSIYAGAICEVLDQGRGAYAAGFVNARDNLKWSKMASPLLDWMASPEITHGVGAEFFTGTLGKTSPHSRPFDIRSAIRKLFP